MVITMTKPELTLEMINSIDKIPELVNWEQLNQKYNLAENFLINHCDRFSGQWILIEQVLREEFIEEYFIKQPIWTDHRNYICTILGYQKVSEAFIERNVPDGDAGWGIASMDQTLSENFIYKNMKNVSWLDIFENQTLSEKFLLQCLKSGWWHINNDDYSKAYFRAIWSAISCGQPLSYEFIKGHHIDIDFEGLSSSKYPIDLRALSEYCENFNWMKVIKKQVVPLDILKNNCARITIDINSSETFINLIQLLPRNQQVLVRDVLTQMVEENNGSK